MLHGTITGAGRSFASFGEIVQGRLSNGEDFLVTLPVDLWSSCQLSCTSIQGRSVVNTAFSKARTVAEHILRELDMHSGVRVELSFQRDMPVGKGLSSSTADMLAVVRAFQQAFDFTLNADAISRLFTQVEPHDALHYQNSVVYNHRWGRLLQQLNYTPDFCIVGVDAGGELSTLAYNQQLDFTAAQLSAYDRLYADLVTAFTQRDDAAIARCASRSAQLHVERSGNAFLAELLQKIDESGLSYILGILATHSGTCAGLLLPGDVDAVQINKVKDAVGSPGRIFTTHTLSKVS